MKYKIARAVVALTWVAIAINFAAPFPGDAAAFFSYLAIILSVLHLIEFAALRNKCLSGSSDSAIKQFLMTFFYGIAYLHDQPESVK